MRICEGRISSPFGQREHPVTGQVHFHNGVDVACPVGTPISSPGEAIVHSIRRDDLNGLRLELRCGPISYVFCHLSKTVVHEGQIIKAGNVIALSGNTGRSTGPHLHFTVYKGLQPIDPEPYLEIHY